MPKVRKEIPELENLMQVGRKKFVRYEEGAQLYSMGVHTFQELAKDAKAVQEAYAEKYDLTKGQVLFCTKKYIPAVNFCKTVNQILNKM